MNVDIKQINEILANPEKGKRVKSYQHPKSYGVTINVYETTIPDLFIQVPYTDNSYGDVEVGNIQFVQKTTKTIETYE